MLPPGQAQRVFISYATPDVAWAELLEAILEAHGVETWRASARLRASDAWRSELHSAILGCTHLLALVTTESIQSDWVREEVTAALAARACTVVPVLVEAVDPGALVPTLGSVQTVRFNESYLTGIKEIAEVFGVRFLCADDIRRVAGERRDDDRRSDDRRGGGERRNRDAVVRLRYGLKLSLQRNSCTALLDYWSSSSYRLSKLEKWLSDEARCYTFTARRTRQQLDPDAALKLAIEWVEHTHGHRSDMKTAYLADYVVEYLQGHYDVECVDRRDTERRDTERRAT